MNDDLRAKVVEVVTDHLEQEFGLGTIAKVEVSPSTDRYGDELIEIRVVLRGASADLQKRCAKTMASAVLTLRSELDKVDSDINTLLSFVSANEYLRRKRVSGRALS